MANSEAIKASDKFKTGLLEQWQKLLKDKIDTVKICAVEATPSNLKLMVGRKSEIDEHIRGYF